MSTTSKENVSKGIFNWKCINLNFEVTILQLIHLFTMNS